mgnify:CR=1 FL=1|jgi:hypothetical protein
MSYKGWFKPQNPKKYKGDPNQIVYRSNWELRVMKYLDNNPNVIWWASEELFVPYTSPIDQKIHRYFPDFITKIKQKDGKELIVMIEVKPEKQTLKPIQGKRRTKKFIQEAATYAINQEKWRAADLFCKEHGWQFKIITEKELGL